MMLKERMFNGSWPPQFLLALLLQLKVEIRYFPLQKWWSASNVPTIGHRRSLVAEGFGVFCLFGIFLF